jgi:hypothetical protein
MYFPRNWEFDSALSKLRNFGGGVKLPSRYATVPNMKLRMKGRRFDTTEEIHAETQEVIDTLTSENLRGDA